MDAPISFKELFNSEHKGIHRVVIPKIQRAYAQGRKDPRTTRTRIKFLDSIYNAISDNNEMILDFIYGNKDEAGNFIPLDGQQRLTTLFLLHWYAAKKAQIEEHETKFLKGFSYETRYSARDFCAHLIDYNPNWEGLLSDEIMDQAWFPLDWKYDATVESMLVMLDAINEKFNDIPNLWPVLDSIKFYFLPIDEMGLTDDIYIKMNSRGKPLTDFEHFKAEFEKTLKEVDVEIAHRVVRKIDTEWTDMLWPYKGDNNIIDDEFLRFFRFVCDILCYREGKSPKHNDEFLLISEFFKGDNAKNNIETLESFFDSWNGKDLKALFDKFISVDGHLHGKILLRRANQKYLFMDCLSDYADVLGNRNRKFTLNQIILLYAFTLYRLNSNKITEEQFARRLRIIYNLILNSTYEISDSENRTSGNRMPAILRQVDEIIIKGLVPQKEDNDDVDAHRLGFNPNQLEEERQKLAFTTNNPEWEEALFALEDHNLIRGQIAIVGLEAPERFERFKALFDCDWDLVDCALLAIGNYSRRDNNWRIQMGTSKSFDSAWRNVFDHNSTAKGFEKAKECLATILQNEFINKDYLKAIKDQYLSQCEEKSEFDWRYYYIKYPKMRLGRYGKYTQYEDRSYEMVAIYAAQYESSNSFQLFLNELGKVNSAWNGRRLTVNDAGDYISCENSRYVLRDINDQQIDEMLIPQTPDGIDTVNRIEFALTHLSKWGL